MAVSWAAVVFAADGLLTVALDREPVPSGVSPYYGLVAFALAGLVLWIVLARAPRSPSPLLPALVAAAGVYLVLVASGVAGGLRLVVVEATSPFSLVAVSVAVVTATAFWIGMRAWRRRTP